MRKILLLTVLVFTSVAIFADGTEDKEIKPNPITIGKGSLGNGGRSLTAVVGTFSADTSELTLIFDSSDNTSADVTIIGDNGVIISENVSTAGGSTTIDTSSLTVGYYTITIEMDNGDIYSGNFEINAL